MSRHSGEWQELFNSVALSGSVVARKSRGEMGIRSLHKLFALLENLDYEMRFLTSYIYLLAGEAEGMQGRSYKIFHSLGEICSYVSEQTCRYVLFIAPDHLLIGLQGQGIDRIIRADELEELFAGRWTPDSLAIAVS